MGNPIRPEIAFVSSSPPPGFMPGASWVSSGWVFNVGCSQDLGDQSVFAPREGDERIRVTFIVWRAAAPVVGSTFWEDSLFLVPISPCSGAGLRGRSEKSWLYEFLHYPPPRLIFNHVLSVPITHKALSLSPQCLCSCGLFCMEGLPLPPPDKSYSNFQVHVKHHLLQEAFLDAPRLGHVTLLCAR